MKGEYYIGVKGMGRESYTNPPKLAGPVSTMFARNPKLFIDL